MVESFSGVCKKPLCGTVCSISVCHESEKLPAILIFKEQTTYITTVNKIEMLNFIQCHKRKI